MFGSVKLGKLVGIDLYVHGTFWLLPLFVLFNGVAAGDVSGAAFDVAVLFAIFGCVVLHECGHALAARYYGIGTRDITLYPVGGVASLERMPRRPSHEIVVALAGPAVNVLIALGILGSIFAADSALPGGWTSADTGALEVFLGRLFWANVVLVGFNLLPAFPMDGGRVLRALLSFGLPRVQATHWAANVGAVVAAGFFLVGLYAILNPGTGFSPMLMILAAVVFMLGRAELAAVRMQEGRREWQRRAADHYSGAPVEEDAGRAEPFTGWRWDPLRRVWTEWRGGVAVREIHVV